MVGYTGASAMEADQRAQVLQTDPADRWPLPVPMPEEAAKTAVWTLSGSKYAQPRRHELDIHCASAAKNYHESLYY